MTKTKSQLRAEAVENVNKPGETYMVSGFSNHIRVYGGAAFIDGSQVRLLNVRQSSANERD
ncbi:MAG: hypothetical protein IJH04_01820 [Eggerthellaceae bacterium]|nr:hypothetical protein [Eggerthellaceae bacterium]